MNIYLVEQEHSAKVLIENIYKEENEFKHLYEQIEVLKKHFEYLQWDFTTAEQGEDFSDMQIQNKFIKMTKKHEELTETKNEIFKLEKSIQEKESSMNSLSMSLLQIAKQGISTVHGELKNCPNGKLLKSEPLKNVIWQGRNQSIHSEEGNPRKSTIDCFTNLANDFGSDFDIITDPKANKAKKVIDLLDWKNYKNYENDMISLIG